jgi:hypothetical protein
VLLLGVQRVARVKFDHVVAESWLTMSVGEPPALLEASDYGTPWSMWSLKDSLRYLGLAEALRKKLGFGQKFHGKGKTQEAYTK